MRVTERPAVRLRCMGYLCATDFRAARARQCAWCMQCMRVANDPGASSRSKHFLRRYFVLRQRIAAGVAKIVKVPDPQMPADFLTKWLPAKKFNLSLDYATNASAARASSKDA